MKNKAISAAALACLLSACGGGGDGSPAPAPNAVTFDMNTAWGFALSKGVSFSGLQATAQGITFVMSISYTPTTDGPLQGITYKRSTLATTMSASTATAMSTTATEYYTLNPTRMVGEVRDDGSMTLFTWQGDLPSAGSVGQSGPYFRATGYTSTPGGSAIGEAVVTWSLEEDTATTAWACLSMSLPSAGTFYEKDCLRIDQSGAISGARAVLNVDGQTVVFQ
jgi:hypothetical protein